MGVVGVGVGRGDRSGARQGEGGGGVGGKEWGVGGDVCLLARSGNASMQAGWSRGAGPRH